MLSRRQMSLRALKCNFIQYMFAVLTAGCLELVFLWIQWSAINFDEFGKGSRSSSGSEFGPALSKTCRDDAGDSITSRDAGTAALF